MYARNMHTLEYVFEWKHTKVSFKDILTSNNLPVPR